MNYPRGLAMGWNLEGIRFDVYELFSAVVRAGGSSTVSIQSSGDNTIHLYLP